MFSRGVTLYCKGLITQLNGRVVFSGATAGRGTVCLSLCGWKKKEHVQVFRLVPVRRYRGFFMALPMLKVISLAHSPQGQERMVNFNVSPS